MPEKILIDTDPDVDDTMAIFFALNSPELEIVGLTSVFGNTDSDVTAQNALRIVEWGEAQNIPVAKGAGIPLVIPLMPLPQIIQILWIGLRQTFANFDASMPFVDCMMISMRHLLEIFGKATCEQIFQIGVQFALFLFDRATDHVHLNVSGSPCVSVSVIMQLLKERSAHRMLQALVATSLVTRG